MVANGGAEDGAAAAARRQQAMRSLEHAMHRSPGNNPMRSHNARIAAALGYLSGARASPSPRSRRIWALAGRRGVALRRAPPAAPRPTAVLPPAKNRRYDFQRVMKGAPCRQCRCSRGLVCAYTPAPPAAQALREGQDGRSRHTVDGVPCCACRRGRGRVLRRHGKHGGLRGMRRGALVTRTNPGLAGARRAWP